MDIIIDSRGARVDQPDDLRSFSVIIENVSRDGEIDLHGCGVLAQDRAHAFVDPAWIREHVGARSGNPQWSSGFDAMIRFAAGQGWIDELGRIRGHVIESKG